MKLLAVFLVSALLWVGIGFGASFVWTAFKGAEPASDDALVAGR